MIQNTAMCCNNVKHIIKVIHNFAYKLLLVLTVIATLFTSGIQLTKLQLKQNKRHRACKDPNYLLSFIVIFLYIAFKNYQEVTSHKYVLKATHENMCFKKDTTCILFKTNAQTGQYRALNTMYIHSCNFGSYKGTLFNILVMAYQLTYAQ